MDVQSPDDIIKKAQNLSDDELVRIIAQLQALLGERKQTDETDDNGETTPVSLIPLAKAFADANFASGHSDTAENSREILHKGFASHITRKMREDE